MRTSNDSSCLFGRDAEIRGLHEAFQRAVTGVNETDWSGESQEESLLCTYPSESLLQNHLDTQEFVLIDGYSGSGKTSLANSLRHEVQRRSGFFLTGKFELASSQHPYAAFASAFDQFVEDHFSRTNHDSNSHRLDEMQRVIQDAVGEEGRLITDVIPSIELLVGKQTNSTCDIHGTNAVRRFHYLFCKLCRAVSCVAPLVLFLDDLQWSDTASLQLLLALLQSQRSHNSALLVVVAIRKENEGVQRQASTMTGLQHSTSSILNEISKVDSSSKINMTRIHLGLLDAEATHQLVATYLNMTLESSQSLAVDIYTKCNGSPFHSLQLLKDVVSTEFGQDTLHDTLSSSHEALKFSLSCNDEINHLVRDKLLFLPEKVLQILQVSACLGDEIDESAIAIVLDLSMTEIQEAAQKASADGHLAFDHARGLHRFSHDQIRQEAMSLIEDVDSFSFRIGYCLWTKSSPLFLNTKMFVIANLLNHGTNLLADQSERYRAAALNWEAGIRAASLANFSESSRYLKAGIDFLKGGDHWTEKYDLTLSLFNAAADTEVCTQSFDRVIELVQVVLDNAHTLHDKIQAYVAKINCLCQNGQTQQAINIGIDVLQQLGEPLSHNATKSAIIREMIMTKLALAGRSNFDMMSRRPMENQDKLHAMHLLAVLVPYAFHAKSMYNPLMATRMVRLCVKYGFHKSGVIGLVTYSWVLCAVDRKEGYRLGTQALSMVERLRAKEMRPRVHAFFYGFTHHWRRPVRESLEPLKLAADAAMEIGDVECAMWAFYFRCVHLIVCGFPLSQVEAQFEETALKMRLYKQESMLPLINIAQHYIKSLTQRHYAPSLNADQVAPPKDNECDFANAILVKFSYMSTNANLAYRFGEYHRAEDLAESSRRLKYDHIASYNSCSVRLFEALISISCARLGRERRKNCNIARQGLKKITSWAADCPENFSYLQKMLEAELRSLKPQKGVNVWTHALYNQAITEATKEGFTQHAALACELAGDYLYRQGELVSAKQYWVEAHSKYMTWGATVKAAELRNKTGI